MQKTKVKIVNIRESRRHPGYIYADLVDATDGTPVVGATLDHIFELFRERPEYDCINVTQDKWGNYVVRG